MVAQRVLGAAGAVPGRRQLPCGKPLGWVSPAPGSRPALLDSVTQTGTRGGCVGLGCAGLRASLR